MVRTWTPWATSISGRCKPNLGRRAGGMSVLGIARPTSERVGVGRLISRHVDIVCNGKYARFLNIWTYAISEVVEAS